MFNRFNTLPTWLNSVVIWMQSGEKLGKYAWYRLINRLFLGSVIRYQTDNGEFIAPTNEWCFWELGRPENYYLDEFTPFIELINKQTQPFTFFDMGADIGTVSAMVSARCTHLQNAIAFEPNPGAYSLLTHNMDQCVKNGLAVNQAISNTQTTAILHTRDRELGDHEGFIDTSNGGDTQVTSLDYYVKTNPVALAPMISPMIVLKIDVEGLEVEAIQGAKSIIQHATQCIVMVEIHPEVLNRLNQTPETLFSTLEAIRPVTWLVPKLNNQILDRTKPMFTQLPTQQYDLIAVANY